MLILALDTTTRAGSVAVVGDDTVLAVVDGDASRTHAERLPAEIEHALAQAAVRPQAIDLLAVASGPGAFTGLRIGLAAMQGLAMVLGKPVVGVSALAALAAATAHYRPSSRIATWMDAQRGEVFAACFLANALVCEASPATVGPPPVILREMPFDASDPVTFVGDGARRYAAEILAVFGERATVLQESFALAPFIATLGREQARAGAAGPPHALQPLYVRRPDAEIDRDRKGGA